MNFNILKELAIFHLFYTITFVISGIMINLIQIFLYFSLRIFNKTLFRKINYYLTYSMFSLITFLFDWWADSIITIHTDINDFKKYYGKEHAFLIINHFYNIDWLVMAYFSDGVKLLGNLKGFVKKSLQYIPTIGWTWKFGNYVFLDRSFDKDEKTILMQIQEITEYPDPTWLILFPEGTRFTPSKHEASQKFAEKNKLTLLKNHLVPRTKGFTTSLKAMRGKIDAIYDVNLAFKKSDKNAPTLKSLLFGQKLHAHLHITRILISEIPETDEGAAQWLYDRFVIKDKLQETFHKTGKFSDEPGTKKIQSFKMPRRLHPILNYIFWTSFILIPILKYLADLLMSGEFFSISIVIAVFSTFHVILQRLIGLTVSEDALPRGDKKEKAV